MKRLTRKTAFQLEFLESRRLLNALTVTSAADSGVGSLRAQVAAAQSGDSISFAPGLAGQTITLTSGAIAFAKSLTIQGLGANQLAISGNNLGHIFVLNGSANQAAIRDLTLTGGRGAGGAGGAIFNWGTLTVSGCTFSGNDADFGGGAIYNDGTLTVSDSNFSGNSARYGGGAIANAGILTISGSNLSGNTSYNGTIPENGGGGAIWTNGGAVTVSNCTIANNHAIGFIYFIYDDDGNIISRVDEIALGGGVFVGEGGGTLSIDHSTLAGNEAITGVGEPGFEGSGSGGAIYGGAVQLYDTIVADNYAGFGPDLYVTTVTSLGHNLIGNSSGASGFVASDLLNVNPQLGPLQNNGGPTPMIALLPGSPAINAGDNVNAPAYDQRGAGFPRIVGGSIDIGAFESATPIGTIWIGPASGGSWSTAANWSPSGVPAASDLVTISQKSVSLGESATVGGLALTGGAALTVAANGGWVLRTSSISVAGAGSNLNLSNNKLIVAGGGLGVVTALIASGRNGGAWNGNGIVTSSASGNFTTLGVAASGADVVVKFTYGGDANLDGKINIDDYVKIDTGSANRATGWNNGDFNYDGKIDIDDYTIIDGNLPNQGPPLLASNSMPTVASATVFVTHAIKLANFVERKKATTVLESDETG